MYFNPKRYYSLSLEFDALLLLLQALLLYVDDSLSRIKESV